MKLQQILLTVFAFFFINEMKAEGAQFNIDSLLQKGPSAALHRRIDYRQDSLVKNFPSNVSEQFQAQINSIHRGWSLIPDFLCVTLQVLWQGEDLRRFRLLFLFLLS